MTVLIVLCVISVSPAEEEHYEECPPKSIRSVPVNPNKLFIGEWNYLKCIPSTFCDHLTCYGHKFFTDDHMVYSISSAAYNTSAEKEWSADGICQVNAKAGLVRYDGTDPRASSLYHMLGTDYNHWWLIFSCIPDIYGNVKPAAWIASRDLELKPSVIPTVKKLIERNGLNWDDFHTITDPSCMDYKNTYKGGYEGGY